MKVSIADRRAATHHLKAVLSVFQTIEALKAAGWHPTDPVYQNAKKLLRDTMEVTEIILRKTGCFNESAKDIFNLVNSKHI